MHAGGPLPAAVVSVECRGCGFPRRLRTRPEIAYLEQGHEWIEGPEDVLFRVTVRHPSPVPFMNSIPFEVLVFSTGFFRLTGHGGFENWCHSGQTVSKERGNGRVRFTASTR